MAVIEKSTLEGYFVEVRVNQEDLDRLVELLSDYPIAGEALSELVAENLEQFARTRTPVKTGALKASWSGVQSTESGASFHMGLPYGNIIEEGLYQTVGPHTIRVGHKIFSTQAVGGIVEPMLNEEDTEGHNLSDAVAIAVTQLESRINAGTS